jgi:hypothetical protein
MSTETTAVLVALAICSASLLAAGVGPALAAMALRYVIEWKKEHNHGR